MPAASDPHPRAPRPAAGVLAALPGAVTALVLLWTGDTAEGPVDARRPRRRRLSGVRAGAAGAGRAAAADALEPAGRAARGGLLDPRPRRPAATIALGVVMLEVNALAETLREQRLGALEATALLRKVMEEIDVAVFAFDGERRLQLVNRAGERLLGQPEPTPARPDRRRARARRIASPRAPRAFSTRRSPAGPGDGRSARCTFRQGGVAAPAARARRREPAAARGGAPGVAAADPRALPRDQQLARADQVDRRQPAEPAPRRAPPGLARGPAARARGDRVARGGARAASCTATPLARLPAPRPRRSTSPTLLRRVVEPRDAAARRGRSRPGSRHRPTATSSSSS